MESSAAPSLAGERWLVSAAGLAATTVPASMPIGQHHTQSEMRPQRIPFVIASEQAALLKIGTTSSASAIRAWLA